MIHTTRDLLLGELDRAVQGDYLAFDFRVKVGHRYPPGLALPWLRLNTRSSTRPTRLALLVGLTQGPDRGAALAVGRVQASAEGYAQQRIPSEPLRPCPRRMPSSAVCSLNQVSSSRTGVRRTGVPSSLLMI